MPVVLVLNEVVLVIVLDFTRETLPPSRSTSTGETPEYEYDQESLGGDAFSFQIDAVELEHSAATHATTEPAHASL